MSTTITAGNATNGLAFSADNTGQLEVKTGTGAGTTALTLDTSQNATFAGTVTTVTGTIYPLVRGTSVASTSGTSIDFTGIPSTVRRLTVMLNGVSTTGISPLLIQLGISTGPITTGYLGASTYMASTVATAALTSGFLFNNWVAAANLGYGSITFTNLTGNQWVGSGTVANTNTASNFVISGAIALGALLDRVRITTVGGTDTFDAGNINILWE